MQVERQMADAGTQMMQVTPQQAEQNDFHQWVGHHGSEGFERFPGTQGLLPQPEEQGEKQEQYRATDPVHARDYGHYRKPYREQIEMFRSGFGHLSTFLMRMKSGNRPGERFRSRSINWRRLRENRAKPARLPSGEQEAGLHRRTALEDSFTTVQPLIRACSNTPFPRKSYRARTIECYQLSLHR